METLSGENMDEYLNAMDDEIQSLMRRDTWEIVLRNSISDQNVLPGTCSSSARGNLVGQTRNLSHNIV